MEKKVFVSEWIDRYDWKRWGVPKGEAGIASQVKDGGWQINFRGQTFKFSEEQRLKASNAEPQRIGCIAAEMPPQEDIDVYLVGPPPEE